MFPYTINFSSFSFSFSGGKRKKSTTKDSPKETFSTKFSHRVLYSKYSFFPPPVLTVLLPQQNNLTRWVGTFTLSGCTFGTSTSSRIRTTRESPPQFHTFVNDSVTCSYLYPKDNKNIPAVLMVAKLLFKLAIPMF